MVSRSSPLAPPRSSSLSLSLAQLSIQSAPFCILPPRLSTPLATNAEAIKCLICWPSRCQLFLHQPPAPCPPLCTSLPPATLFACLPNAKHHHNNYGKIVLVNAHRHTHTRTHVAAIAVLLLLLALQICGHFRCDTKWRESGRGRERERDREWETALCMLRDAAGPF